MTEFKPVPGPWIEHNYAIYASQPQDVDHRHFRGFNQIEPGAPGYLVAESIPHGDTRRLIKAAPALYHALVMVRDADDDCHKDGKPTIPPMARDRIDQAIALAEQEAA